MSEERRRAVELLAAAVLAEAKNACQAFSTVMRLCREYPLAAEEGLALMDLVELRSGWRLSPALIA